jgi:hypothetical protein
MSLPNTGRVNASLSASSLSVAFASERPVTAARSNTAGSLLTISRHLVELHGGEMVIHRLKPSPASLRLN